MLLEFVGFSPHPPKMFQLFAIQQRKYTIGELREHLKSQKIRPFKQDTDQKTANETRWLLEIVNFYQ